MVGDPRRLVRIGVVTRAHGIRGEVVVRPDVSGSTTLLEHKSVFLQRAATDPREVEMGSARAAHDSLLVRFVGCNDRDQAEALAGHEVLVPRASLPVPESGEYYAADLVGLCVKGVQGEVLGRVVGLFDAGAAPVLEIAGERSFQVPLVDIFVKRIDLEAGEIVVEPPEEEESGAGKG